MTAAHPTIMSKITVPRHATALTTNHGASMTKQYAGEKGAAASIRVGIVNGCVWPTSTQEKLNDQFDDDASVEFRDPLDARRHVLRFGIGEAMPER